VAAMDIMTRYSVLYNLIKHEVVPYMERKSLEAKVEKMTKEHTHNLKRCIDAHTRLSQQHAAAQVELERKFKEKESYLQRLISEYQEKLDALQGL
jgi:Iap family predicted aminopeptidase